MGTQQAWAAPTVPIRTGRDWEKGAKVWGTAGGGGRAKTGVKGPVHTLWVQVLAPFFPTWGAWAGP